MEHAEKKILIPERTATYRELAQGIGVVIVCSIFAYRQGKYRVLKRLYKALLEIDPTSDR